MKMPLEGIRVIETGGWMAGPLAARHLGDMGAEVIKIEHPVAGDPARGLAMAKTPRDRYTGGFHEVMEICNRNKRSIGIDLYHQRGREIMHKLVEGSDVFITNLRDKALVKMELDYDALAKINPKIIYGIGTGWGRKGPDKDRPGFDLAAFAMGGAMNQMSWANAPPAPLGVAGLGDEINSLVLALGIMTALFYRERTGVGQIVHASLIGSWLEVGGIMLQRALYRGTDMARDTREAAGSPVWNCYQTKDGRYIQLAMMQSDPYWHDLCQALDTGEVENDPRFNSHWARMENKVELISIFDNAFAKRTFSEWQKRLKGYTIVWAPILTYTEVAKDQQIRENDYIVKIEHPEYGTIETVGIPFQLSKTPGAVRRVCPELGQHTEEILLEFGYTWDDIVKLKGQKAIT